MKTILVPMENHEAMRAALDAALLLARRCNSYIEGFALPVRTLEYVGLDIVVGVPVDTEGLEQEAEKSRLIFDSFMQEHGVPRSTKTTEGLSYGWLDTAPESENFVGSYGRVFDVIVMNRPDETSSGLYRRAIEFGAVRKRSADTPRSAVATTADRQQRIDRVEPQHGAGTSHRPCIAASSEGRPHHCADS